MAFLPAGQIRRFSAIQIYSQIYSQTSSYDHPTPLSADPIHKGMYSQTSSYPPPPHSPIGRSYPQGNVQSNLVIPTPPIPPPIGRSYPRGNVQSNLVIPSPLIPPPPPSVDPIHKGRYSQTSSYQHLPSPPPITPPPPHRSILSTRECTVKPTLVLSTRSHTL